MYNVNQYLIVKVLHKKYTILPADYHLCTYIVQCTMYIHMYCMYIL